MVNLRFASCESNALLRVLIPLIGMFGEFGEHLAYENTADQYATANTIKIQIGNRK